MIHLCWKCVQDNLKLPLLPAGYLLKIKNEYKTLEKQYVIDKITKIPLTKHVLSKKWLKSILKI